MKATHFLPIFILSTPTIAGPIAFGICQAGCASVVMACYAAGATWSAALSATTPTTVVACNAAFGTRSAACAVDTVLPTLQHI